jgi:hypothetical protein
VSSQNKIVLRPSRTISKIAVLLMMTLLCILLYAIFSGIVWLALVIPWVGFYLWRLKRGYFSWQQQQVFEFGEGAWSLSSNSHGLEQISSIRVDRVWPRLVLLEVKIAGRWQWLVLSAERSEDADAMRRLRILLREVYTGREYSVEGTGQ